MNTFVATSGSTPWNTFGTFELPDMSFTTLLIVSLTSIDATDDSLMLFATSS